MKCSVNMRYSLLSGVIQDKSPLWGPQLPHLFQIHSQLPITDSLEQDPASSQHPGPPPPAWAHSSPPCNSRV